MIAEIFGITNVGLIRHDNQDAFLIANLETGDIATMSAPSLVSVHTAPFIMIVADGVGGAASGALASSIATETILSELHRWWHKVPKRTPDTSGDTPRTLGKSSISSASERGSCDGIRTSATGSEHRWLSGWVASTVKSGSSQVVESPTKLDLT